MGKKRMRPPNGSVRSCEREDQAIGIADDDAFRQRTEGDIEQVRNVAAH